MKDQNIYKQAVQEIVEDKENDYLNAADIRRIANLAEKYYRQGYEDAKEVDEPVHTVVSKINSDGKVLAEQIMQADAKEK